MSQLEKHSAAKGLLVAVAMAAASVTPIFAHAEDRCDKKPRHERPRAFGPHVVAVAHASGFALQGCFPNTCEQERDKGNNGVGNGEDGQPPGDPPVNDGEGTGPGNPGNQGGAGSSSGTGGAGGNAGGSAQVCPERFEKAFNLSVMHFSHPPLTPAEAKDLANFDRKPPATQDWQGRCQHNFLKEKARKWAERRFELQAYFWLDGRQYQFDDVEVHVDTQIDAKTHKRHALRLGDIMNCSWRSWHKTRFVSVRGTIKASYPKTGPASSGKMHLIWRGGGSRLASGFLKFDDAPAPVYLLAQVGTGYYWWCRPGWHAFTKKGREEAGEWDEDDDHGKEDHERKAKEEEQQRRADEERKRQEEEQKRKLEEERKRKEEEQKRKLEEERKRKEEEQKKKQDEERKRQEEQKKKEQEQKDKRKGNNGVGNGEDPQPPGDPKQNDGAGTGPGNPGNKRPAKGRPVSKK